MTGIGLDSVNRPDKNFIKVLFMVIANIIGDLIAIFVFKSLSMVAVTSILFTSLGVWIGFHFLNKELDLEFFQINRHGISFYRSLIRKIKNHQMKGRSETPN
jgi:uncharacterized membrane protein